MLVIERPQTDPYFNIAAEEYFLKSLDEDCFMLWINDPAVVIGKHQNAFAEINNPFIENNNIPVIRRISGGGTVYHDPGNLNFTFLARGEKEKLVDFKRFMDPVIGYLKLLGLPAEFAGTNDIRIHGRKVSGNAEHVYKNRVLHHGTLLFSSELEPLNKAIAGEEHFFKDTGVRSRRSRVTNIASLLSSPITLDQFQQGILNYMDSHHGPLKHRSITSREKQTIESLAMEKYQTWEWNFGYSPRFLFTKEIHSNESTIQLMLEVDKGIVTQIQTGDKTLDKILDKEFLGKRFCSSEVFNRVENPSGSSSC
jgi:lipoate-protein ligase A